MPKQSGNGHSEKGKKKTAKKPIKNVEKKEKKKTGCPSEYATKVKPYLADIARYYRCGVTEGQLCEFYNVGKTSWAKYKKENPELAETLLNAKREFKTNLLNKAYEVAMGSVYTDTKTTTYKDEHGNVTGTKIDEIKRTIKPDAGMLQFLLINRFPDEFARDPQMVELRRQALALAEQGKLTPGETEGI